MESGLREEALGDGREAGRWEGRGLVGRKTWGAVEVRGEQKWGR